MVYIPYPRAEKDNHPDLAAWRGITNKKAGDWGELKPFLAEQPRLLPGMHAIPKCWYTEMPQGDNYALDVEHFRPKKQASPLPINKIERIETQIGVPIFQEISDGAYPWLEFDYRNYRLTTALPNRGGAKHMYFPIAKGSSRLAPAALPWQQPEYNLLLDPADPLDADLLLVLPNGEIIPKTAKTPVTLAELQNLPENWRSPGFNYMRAWVTIITYRLDERILQEARKEAFENTTSKIKKMVYCLEKNIDPFIMDDYIKSIIHSILPSAPFALAARCAVSSYVLDATANQLLRDTVDRKLYEILSAIGTLVANHKVDWTKN